MTDETTFTLKDVTGSSWEFKHLAELRSFLSVETVFWAGKFAELELEARDTHSYLRVSRNINSSLSHINELISNQDSWSEQQRTQKITQIQQSLTGLKNSWLWSNHPYITQFLESQKKYGKEGANQYLDVLLGRHIKAGNSIHPNIFNSALLAYEFLHQDSDITKRRKSEKASLSRLRTRLDQTTTELIGEVEGFKTDIQQWNDGVKTEWSEWQDQTAEEHATTQSERSEEFSGYLSKCKTDIADLESLYREKLKLEAPAQYWKKAAKKYLWQGIAWGVLLVVSLLFAFYTFTGFFEDWLWDMQSDIKLDTLQGIIIFGSAVAVFAYWIRVLSRMVFSSFHLMRDAEEREQLTYLYLALSKESEVDEESRRVVLQALFSRSETGLLASESGPTMPGIQDVFKAAAGKK